MNGRKENKKGNNGIQKGRGHIVLFYSSVILLACTAFRRSLRGAASFLACLTHSDYSAILFDFWIKFAILFSGLRSLFWAWRLLAVLASWGSDTDDVVLLVVMSTDDSPCTEIYGYVFHTKTALISYTNCRTKQPGTCTPRSAKSYTVLASS